MTTFRGYFLWGGGALFVSALAVCAYFYAIVWATPSSVGGWSAIAADSVLFTLFASHHSLLARESAKRVLTRFVPDVLLRSVYVWTASLLLLLVLALWQRVAGEVYHVVGWLAAGPAAVQLAGLWLTIRSAALIDPLELAGIKPEPPRTDVQTLQMTGPYRLVRHPIYLGWVLMVFGTGHMTADRLVFATISTAYIALAIPWEERSLLRAFGPAYARYREVVRWRMLPFVY